MAPPSGFSSPSSKSKVLRSARAWAAEASDTSTRPSRPPSDPLEVLSSFSGAGAGGGAPSAERPVGCLEQLLERRDGRPRILAGAHTFACAGDQPQSGRRAQLAM